MLANGLYFSQDTAVDEIQMGYLQRGAKYRPIYTVGQIEPMSHYSSKTEPDRNIVTMEGL